MMSVSHMPALKSAGTLSSLMSISIKTMMMLINFIFIQQKWLNTNFIRFCISFYLFPSQAVGVGQRLELQYLVCLAYKDNRLLQDFHCEWNTHISSRVQYLINSTDIINLDAHSAYSKFQEPYIQSKYLHDEFLNLFGVKQILLEANEANCNL